MNAAVGDTFDVEWTMDKPGFWIFQDFRATWRKVPCYVNSNIHETMFENDFIAEACKIMMEHSRYHEDSDDGDDEGGQVQSLDHAVSCSGNPFAKYMTGKCDGFRSRHLLSELRTLKNGMVKPSEYLVKLYSGKDYIGALFTFVNQLKCCVYKSETRIDLTHLQTSVDKVIQDRTKRLEKVRNRLLHLTRRSDKSTVVDREALNQAAHEFFLDAWKQVRNVLIFIIQPQAIRIGNEESDVT